MSGGGSLSQGGGVSFLDNKNMNDPSFLRKKIAELESENKKLKSD